MPDSINRMKELAAKLDKASEVYYQGKDEIMSNLSMTNYMMNCLVLRRKQAWYWLEARLLKWVTRF